MDFPAFAAVYHFPDGQIAINYKRMGTKEQYTSANSIFKCD